MQEELLGALRVWREVLLEHAVVPGRMAVVGEDAGAALALLFAGEAPGVQAAVLLSPSLGEGGANLQSAMRTLGETPVLLIAGEGDAHAAASVAALKRAAPGFSELRVYPGAGHGLDLFETSRSAGDLTLDWLATVLPGS